MSLPHLSRHLHNTIARNSNTKHSQEPILYILLSNIIRQLECVSTTSTVMGRYYGSHNFLPKFLEILKFEIHNSNTTSNLKSTMVTTLVILHITQIHIYNIITTFTMSFAQYGCKKFKYKAFKRTYSLYIYIFYQSIYLVSI